MRVRVIMADHSRAAAARRAVRGDEYGRVYFKVPVRIGGDIAARYQPRHPQSLTQQQAAYFTRRVTRRFVRDRRQRTA